MHCFKLGTGMTCDHHCMVEIAPAAVTASQGTQCSWESTAGDSPGTNDGLVVFIFKLKNNVLVLKNIFVSTT
jgi:hypothetical protein